MVNTANTNITLLGSSDKARIDFIKEYLNNPSIDLASLERDIFLDSVISVQVYNNNI